MEETTREHSKKERLKLLVLSNIPIYFASGFYNLFNYSTACSAADSCRRSPSNIPRLAAMLSHTLKMLLILN